VEVFLRTYVPSRLSHGSITEDSLDCPLVETARNKPGRTLIAPRQILW
jgi:hypothetical protein